MTTEQVNQRLEAWAKASGRRSVYWRVESISTRYPDGDAIERNGVHVFASGMCLASGEGDSLADAYADMLEELAEVDETAREMAAE